MRRPFLSRALSLGPSLFVAVLVAILVAVTASGCDGKSLDPPPSTTDGDADLDASPVDLDAADTADTAFDDGTPVRVDCAVGRRQPCRAR